MNSKTLIFVLFGLSSCGLDSRGPDLGPAAKLGFDFTAGSNSLSGLTFSRATSAAFFDSTGNLTTVAANIPRFEYDPLTHLLNGLLMEETATNLLPFSDQVGTAPWTTFNSSYTPNSTTAPDGSAHGTLIRENAANNFHVSGVDNITYAPGTLVTLSGFLKAATRTQVEIVIQNSSNQADSVYARFDLNLGSVLNTGTSGTATSVQAGILPAGNGWYRAWVSGVPSTGFTAMSAAFTSIAGGAGSYAGDGTSGYYLWGGQFETGTAPSSFITTNASATIRAADSAQLSDATLINPGAGTLYAEYINLGSESAGSYPVFGLFHTSDGSYSQNGIVLADSGTLGMSAVISGGATLFNPGGTVQATGVVNKLALAYAPNGFAFSANGGAVLVQSSGTLPAAPTVAFVSSQPGGAGRRRYLKKIRYFDSRLADSELLMLTK